MWLLFPTRPASRPACVPVLPVEPNAQVERLREDFLGAAHVAQRAQRVGPAAGNHVGLASQRGHLVGDLLHFRGEVDAALHDRDGLDAEQAKQEVVAARVGVVAVRHALLEDQPAFQALLDRGGQRETAVVRLNRAARDQRIGALRQRVSDEEFQLSRLVAAAGEAKQVVALDVEVGTAEQGGQPFQFLQRRPALGIPPPGETCEVHASGSLKPGQRAVQAITGDLVIC
jgi:hypothetical protein